jgi:hypothetical protein
MSLLIKRFDLSDEFGTVTGSVNDSLTLGLNSYSFQKADLTVDFTGQNSRLFETYSLDPDNLQVDNGFSVARYFTFESQVVGGPWPPNPISITARVFPGRQTLVPFFIDDSMFSIQNDPAVGQDVVVFDAQRFSDVNAPPVKGFVSDYVEFDISGMPASARPRLSAQSNNASASRLYLTGDNYALSGGASSGPFEVLTVFANQPIVGTYGPPSTLPGGTTPGTFTLQALDPTDIFNLRKIVALQGVWRPYNWVITGFSTWNMVSFPSSTDGFNQEVLYFKRDGNTGKITNLFFGFLDYDLQSIHLFPVKGIVEGIFNPGDEIIGRITGQFDKNGSATVAAQATRTGGFTITTPGALPADAPTSGAFLVFRV